MKTFGGLKLHPRGFLGAPIEYRTAHVTPRPVKADLIGGVSRTITFEPEDNLLKPNNFIEELYAEAAKKEDIIKRNILFRERIYVAALQAFGTVTIQDWIEKQKQNPYFDTMQNRFVEETVGYVFTGFRKYHPAIYAETCAIGTHNAFSMGPNVRSYLFTGTGEPMLMRDFIRRWLTQRDGMSDMFISLRVMFGS